MSRLSTKGKVCKDSMDGQDRSDGSDDAMTAPGPVPKYPGIPLLYEPKEYTYAEPSRTMHSEHT